MRATLLIAAIASLAATACEGTIPSDGSQPTQPGPTTPTADTVGDSIPVGDDTDAGPGAPLPPAPGPAPSPDAGPTDDPPSPGPAPSGPATCDDPGSYVCAGDTTLSFCDADGLEQLYNCMDVCDDAGFDLSFGCDDHPDNGEGTCFCDNVCDPELDRPLCLDDGTVERCVGGRFETTSCADECAPGTAIGCVEDVDGVENCVCETPDAPPMPPAPSCTPGTSCVGADALAICNGTTTETVGCDAVCLDAGYDYATGCAVDPADGTDSCFCDDYPPAPLCVEGSSECIGTTALQVCEDGAPVVLDCDLVCESEGYDFAEACAPDAFTGTDGCFCTTFVCSDNEFTCGDGSCLDGDYVCDGIADCASGGDEFGCAECSDLDPAECIGTTTLEACGNGEYEVIDCESVCLGAGYDFATGCGYDPAVGEDSCECGVFPPTCAVGEVMCGDGGCVPEAYICDDIIDCNDGTDEIDCLPTCDSSEPAECVGAGSVSYCDGVDPVLVDCDILCQDAGYDYAETCDYAPELGEDACICAYANDGCGPDGFACDDGTCIDASYTCDGFIDCSAAEDEAFCE